MRTSMFAEMMGLSSHVAIGPRHRARLRHAAANNWAMGPTDFRAYAADSAAGAAYMTGQIGAMVAAVNQAKQVLGWILNARTAGRWVLRGVVPADSYGAGLATFAGILDARMRTIADVENGSEEPSKWWAGMYETVSGMLEATAAALVGDPVSWVQGLVSDTAATANRYGQKWVDFVNKGLDSPGLVIGALALVVGGYVVLKFLPEIIGGVRAARAR